MQIQDFLIAAVQNIQILIQKTNRRVVCMAQAAADSATNRGSTVITALIFFFGFSLISGQQKAEA